MPRWPLLVLAAPAGVATWSGWVELGKMTGFGEVAPLPGIVDGFVIDTAITLPIGVEAYGAYALGAWLSAAPMRKTTRAFAAVSAVGSLGLGMAGQVAYHLLVAAGRTTAPWWIVTVVACLPVLVLGMGAALGHLIHRDRVAACQQADATRGTDGDDRDIKGDIQAAKGDVESDTGRDTEGDAEGDIVPAPRPVVSLVKSPAVSRDTEGDIQGDTGRDTEGDTAPAPRRRRITSVRAGRRTRKPTKEEQQETRRRAEEIVTAEPEISGAELGRRLGVTPRQGQRLLADIKGDIQAAKGDVESDTGRDTEGDMEGDDDTHVVSLIAVGGER